MPFTFSHPAAILPFVYRKSRHLSATALLAGSVAPDFIYFLTLRKDTNLYTHTLKGMFLFNLPVGILLCFLFHLVVKGPVLAHLPSFLRERLQPFAGLRWTASFRRSAPVVGLSVGLGAGLHILWDRLVHHWAGFFPAEGLVEKTGVESLAHLEEYLFIWSVHSIIGAALLLFSLFRLPRRTVAKGASRPVTFWCGVLVPTAMATLVYGHYNPYRSLDAIVVALTAFFLFFLCLVSLFYRQAAR